MDCNSHVTLTCQNDLGLAADQHAVAVLGGAVVLAHVRVAPLFALLEAPDDQRAVLQHLDLRAGGQRRPVFTPRDRDWLLPLHPTVQHERAIPHRDDITRFKQEGQLRGQAAPWVEEKVIRGTTHMRPVHGHVWSNKPQSMSMNTFMFIDRRMKPR